MARTRQSTDAQQVRELIDALTQEVIAAVVRGDDADALRELHDQARGFVMAGDLNMAKAVLTSRRTVARAPQPRGKIVSIEVVRQRRAQVSM